jgi:N-acyl-D-amino-acid deacylase
VFTQTHSRGMSSVLSLKSRLPFDDLPVWRDVRHLSLERQLAALGDSSTRQALVEEANSDHYGRRIGVEPRRPDYESMMVLQSPLPPNPTVAELAALRKIDPVELIIDLMLRSEGEQFFVQPLNTISEDTLLEGMRHPLSVMTFSDSGAHVSQIMDSSIQTYLLAYWVRQRQEFSLEEAVRMITSVPAEVWGFADRGLLREGLVADLNIFDAAAIAPSLPSVETDLPGGAKRLIQKSVGMLATVVAGQVLLRHGEHSGVLPGQLLRAGRANSRMTSNTV